MRVVACDKVDRRYKFFLGTEEMKGSLEKEIGNWCRALEGISQASRDCFGHAGRNKQRADLQEDGEHHCFGYSVNVSAITSRRHREKNSGWLC